MNTIVTAHNSPDTTSSHYFNVIDGKNIDLTKQQFQNDVYFSNPEPKPEGFNSTLEYILSYQETVYRYKLLKSRVEALLHK